MAKAVSVITCGIVDPPSPAQLELLRDYASGKHGTRDTIERLGLDDFGDLIVALARNGLDLPRPKPSPERDAVLSAILQPLLRR